MPYRILLLPPIDKRLGMRLEDAIELGSYHPEDPAWAATAGDQFTFQGVIYLVALPVQPGDVARGYAGDVYVEI